MFSSEGSIQLVMSCEEVYIYILYAYLDDVWVEWTLQVYTSREGGVIPGRTDEVERFKL